MDGRGSWRDNVFVERLWKSVKYEQVYLHAYDSVTGASVLAQGDRGRRFGASGNDQEPGRLGKERHHHPGHLHPKSYPGFLHGDHGCHLLSQEDRQPAEVVHFSSPFLVRFYSATDTLCHLKRRPTPTP